MLYTVYVDSLYGSDSNQGELISPVATISEALSKVYEGGNIVLQTGDGTSYGNLTVTKNITIKSAYGAQPYMGKIDFTSTQGLVEGIHFYNLSEGIVANNSELGSLIVRECHFDLVTTPVIIENVNYVALHRNFIKSYVFGIRILSATEICISSNIFKSGQRPIDIITVDRLDLWRNTIFDATGSVVSGTPDQNLRIIYKTLNSFDITYKRLQLPGFAAQAVDGRYDVAMNVVNGPSFAYDIDFEVASLGSVVSWEGLRLEQEFAIGDMVRVMYSEDQEFVSGEAIKIFGVGDGNSRIDSNSISGDVTNIGTGVYINQPVTIRSNNFDKVNTWWDGTVDPHGGTGLFNFGESAMYRDPYADDFHLMPSSPNINRGDEGRWTGIYSEMGIRRVNDHYTGGFTGLRSNVSPFDRDIDFDIVHRGETYYSGYTGSVGAFEYNQNETSTGDYVEEYGYDIINPGTETHPYATLDRGYKRSNSGAVHIGTNYVPFSDTGIIYLPATGMSYGRYRSKDIYLNDSFLSIGNQTNNDIIFIYPSNPSIETGLVYISPDGNDSYTGTEESPYRTVARALQDNSPFVVIDPGYYPSFQGATGVKLIGREKINTISVEGELYSNARDGSWTGIGGYLITNDVITMPAASDIQSLFYFNGEIDAKSFITVNSNYLIAKLFNIDNSAYVKINKLAGVITIGFSTGGSTYSINNPIDSIFLDTFYDIKVRIIINGDKFSVRINNKYFSHSYTNLFTSGSLVNWKIQYLNSGTGDDTISDLYVLSDTIVGATGMQETGTLQKVFAIRGATGLQLY